MEKQKENRLSWSVQNPDWTLFPVLKQQNGRDGWFPTGYSDETGSIWALQFCGYVCQFSKLSSPSTVAH